MAKSVTLAKEIERKDCATPEQINMRYPPNRDPEISDRTDILLHMGALPFQFGKFLIPGTTKSMKPDNRP